MKILFLPNYLGGGFGHIGRCLALAEALHQRGGEASFILNGPHAKEVVNAGFDTHSLSRPTVTKPQDRGPAYIYVPEMAFQIVRDGFDNSHTVWTTLKELLAIIKKVKPDALVGDGYPLTSMAGRHAGIPVVQLVKSAVHPAAKPMIWWEETPPGLIVPDVKPVFNPVLKKLRLPEITKYAEELLQGDLLFLPSIPTLDPMDPLPENTLYVGPIIRTRSIKNSSFSGFERIDGSKPVIYVTVGGAAGHGGAYSFFDVVVKAFEGTEWQAVISTGGKHMPEILRGSSNIHVFDWVPGVEMIARSDLVVFHGGYTRMEILIHGVPSIVIPFHSEQEYYGRIIERIGAGLLVHYSEKPYEDYRYHWKGGNRWWRSRGFSVHVRQKMSLRPETLRASIEQCLRNKTMRQTTQKLKHELESYGGCNKAIEIMEKRVF